MIVRYLEGIFKNSPKPISGNQFIKKMYVELHVVGWGLRSDGSEPRMSHLVSRECFHSHTSRRPFHFSALLAHLSCLPQSLPTRHLLV